MAQPIEFKGQNVIYAKDQPEYLPLPVFRDDDGSVISCWKLTDEELEEVKKTGCIYVQNLTFNQPLQPLRVHANLEYFFYLKD